MAADTANTERFVSLTDDDVDKFLAAEENKNTQTNKGHKGRSCGDFEFWLLFGPGCIPHKSHVEDTPRVSKFHAKHLTSGQNPTPIRRGMLGKHFLTQ